MEQENRTPESSEEKPFRGLYRHVKISVKALDWIIGICIALIALLVFLELRSPGFTVTFDSRGGSDVPHQERLHGELLEVPEDPTREGYVFTGWYWDEGCYNLWEMETRQVEADLTLYAGWEKLEEAPADSQPEP